MNRKEIVQAMAIVKAAYPSFYKTADDIKSAVSLWEMMFADDDNSLVLASVKSHITTNKFPPTIADIREKMVDVTTVQVLGEEAWGKVERAIRLYGYNRMEEALEWLGPELGQFTRRFGWRDLCMSENQMADRAHFMKLWDTRSKKEKKDAMLPEGLKKQLAINYQNNDMTKLIEGD